MKLQGDISLPIALQYNACLGSAALQTKGPMWNK
jgi:hypothetical protein